MITVLTAGKAAPGATTSACALATAWPRALLLADCDVAGGDIVPGLMAGRAGADSGLLSWSTTVRQRTDPVSASAALLSHAVQIPEHPMLALLAGFGTAAQGASFTSASWERLAAALAAAGQALGRDVLVDSGRLVGERGCWPVLRVADQILLAVRPSVRSVHAAQDALRRLRSELGDLRTVSALVIGSGPYSAKEVTGALGVPLAGEMPDDAQAALALSDGHGTGGRGLRRSSLLRAASVIANQVVDGHRSRTPVTA